MKFSLALFDWGSKRKKPRPKELVEANIDLSRLKNWFAECQMHHGDSCNTRYTAELSKHIDELILVDVSAGCLTSLPVSTPFIGLSYVWGQAKTTRLTRSNLEILKRPGALDANQKEVVLPNTIRDAMSLVRKLGAEYLWVDCLCLMQDASPSEMNKVLRAMAHIYASADFTIVDAGGEDADHGLPGIGDEVRDRDGWWSPNESIFDRVGYPGRSTWASRGWTFQESLFSRRLLVFGGNVTWICGRCSWMEHVQDSFPRPESWPVHRSHLSTPMGIMSLLGKVPALGHWAMAVEKFSSRSLTFDWDIEAAVAGAAEVIGSTFPGGLLHGLPLFFFDIALLWQPHRLLTRRKGQPSWSWLGWKGRVECSQIWSEYYPGVRRQTGSPKPNDWIASGSLKSLADYRFGGFRSADLDSLNGFYRYQALRNKPNAQLPDGWKRTEHPAGAFYTYTSKVEGAIRYSYPLPFTTSYLQPAPSISSPILICTAPIATLQLGTEPTKTWWGSTELPIVQHGSQIGVMTIHEQHDRHGLEWKGDRLCELAAISEARVPEVAVTTADHYTRDINGPKVSIYNVLWIEWEDEIAYRKGIGAVRKEAWDSLEPETRTFQLG